MSHHHPDDIMILSAARTAIGKFQGALSALPAPQLGATVIRAAIERAGLDPARLAEVIMGNVVAAGIGQAPARQAAIAAGVPEDVSALTINKVCGSGLKAVMLATGLIRAGDGDFYIAGGMENMNLAPYLLTKARFGYRLGNAELVDAVLQDGLWCPFEHQHMGLAAEWIAAHYDIGRSAQDKFAYASHQKALTAMDTGLFQAEIVPTPLPQRKGPPVLFATDENPRRDTSLAALSTLKPAFKEAGTVTAGNAPGITDGAAAVAVARRSAAEARGLKPLAKIVGYAQAAVKPLEIFAAPIFAVRKLAAQLGVAPADFDLVEINEAFAAQTIADIRELGLDETRVNVNGGAIALGHPIGASGARVLVTLLHALRQRGLTTGVASCAWVGVRRWRWRSKSNRHGRLAGLASGLGAATADALYGCVAAFGLTFISSALIGAQVGLRLVGGLFLCYLGIRVFLGSAFWWLLLSGGVSLLRDRFSRRAMTWVNRLSGIVILGFGLFALLAL